MRYPEGIYCENCYFIHVVKPKVDRIDEEINNDYIRKEGKEMGKITVVRNIKNENVAINTWGNVFTPEQAKEILNEVFKEGHTLFSQTYSTFTEAQEILDKWESEGLKESIYCFVNPKEKQGVTLRIDLGQGEKKDLKVMAVKGLEGSIEMNKDKLEDKHIEDIQELLNMIKEMK